MLAPKRDQVAKLDKDIAGKQAEVAQSQAMLSSYETAKASYKTNYATLARLGKAVPADDDVRSLLVQLEATAEHTGVDFTQLELGSGLAGAQSEARPRIRPQATSGELASAPGAIPVAGGALSAMPFNFSFSGGFFDLSTFFAKLEHFVTVNNQRIDATGRLLRLESVSITPSAAGFPDMTGRDRRRRLHRAAGRRCPGHRRRALGRDPEREHDAVDPVVAGFDADHDRDRRSSAMNVLTTTWRQLVRRRLWPVAILLVAALVAVPVLLSRDPAPVTPPEQPASRSGRAVREGRRRARRAGRRQGLRGRPLAPPPCARRPQGPVHAGCREEEAQGGQEGQEGERPLTAPKQEPTSSPSTPAPSTSAPTTPVAPAPPKKVYEKDSLIVRFGDATSKLTRMNVKKLAALPNDPDADPLLVYMGLTDHGKKAVFMVDASLEPSGDGDLQAAPEQLRDDRARRR